jgi:hypothetical protein
MQNFQTASYTPSHHSHHVPYGSRHFTPFTQTQDVVLVFILVYKLGGGNHFFHTVVWGFFHVSMPEVKCGLVIGRFCVLVHYVARAKTLRFTLVLNKTGQSRGRISDFLHVPHSVPVHKHDQSRGRISPLAWKHGKTPKTTV